MKLNNRERERQGGRETGRETGREGQGGGYWTHFIEVLSSIKRMC